MDRIAGAVLYMLCQLLGIRVTSWIRSPAENAALPGASPVSLHLRGAAVDFGQETPADKVELLRSFGFTVERHEKGSAPHWHAYAAGGAAMLIAAAALGMVAALLKALGARRS